MMVVQEKKRNPTVSIEESLYERAKELAKQRGLTLVEYINEILELDIEKDNFLKLYAPYLKNLGFHDNSIVIRDRKLQRIAEIFLKDDKLFCTLCNENSCLHIHYALALPEVAKLQLHKNNNNNHKQVST